VKLILYENYIKLKYIFKNHIVASYKQTNRMSFINDERKRIQFAELMKELAEHDDLIVSMDYGDHEWYGYNKDSELMYVVLEMPEHLVGETNHSLCMTARFECGGAVIRYVLTYGDKCEEHEFYDYDDMMKKDNTDICDGCGSRSPYWADVCCRKCSACGAYESNECKEDCSYQAKQREE